jgi:16S rRNA (guanine527-N7)-methyltransferase
MARTAPPADLAVDREHALALTPVSRETLERLDRFVALLLRWQEKTNLVARSTLPHLWTRHVADSLQLLPLAPEARRWLDVGSGGGFPGLVLACALAQTPGATVDLVESNAKKAAFLRAAIRETGAPAVVHCQRIEDFVAEIPAIPEVVTARAVAPLDVLISWVYPVVDKGAKALLLKGLDVEAELTTAAKYWNIDAALVPSRTDRDGRIVVIRGLQRR